MKAFIAAHVPSLVLTRWVSPGWQSLWQLSGMLHSGLPAWPTLQDKTQHTHLTGSKRALSLQSTQAALYVALPKAQRPARLMSSLLTYRSFREWTSGQFFKQTAPLALVSWSGGGECYWFLQLWCSYVKCTDRGAENATITKSHHFVRHWLALKVHSHHSKKERKKESGCLTTVVQYRLCWSWHCCKR